MVTDAPLRNGGGFRAFLDGSQYKLTGILRYERIFGSGFVSTGGIDTTKARRRAQPKTCSRHCQPFVCAPGWWTVEVAELCACGSWKMTGICPEQICPILCRLARLAQLAQSVLNANATWGPLRRISWRCWT